MGTTKLNITPSKEELYSLYPELKKEYDLTGEGIFCNWDIVIQKFQNERVYTFILEKDPIGFITWSLNEEVVTIDIIWISPIFRHKGLGELFQQLIEREFTKQGFVALHVKCATAEGLKLALKSNFIPILSNDNIDRNNTFNNSEIECIKILKNSTFDLSLCDNDYISVYEDSRAEKLCYKIPLKYDFEANPTYFKIIGDWTACIYINGKLLKILKLKYLLPELHAKTFSWRVACFDHKIELPNNWLTK